MPSTRVVAVSLTYPAATSRESPLGVWFASALNASALDELVNAIDPGSAGDAMVGRYRDASVVFVAIADGVATGVIGWKGLMALNEVYYAGLAAGGWCVSDHFKNAVASIPVADRAMSDDALLQHYLSGAVFDRHTYARGVNRLANGDRVDIDIATRSTSVRIFDRHRSIAVDEPVALHLDRLDAALEDVLVPVRTTENVGIGFSGGVDSTLLLSYMAESGVPITMVPDTPEFGNETEYAEEASQLLGRSIEKMEVREVDYVSLFEKAIDAAAMPLWSTVTPVLAELFEHRSSVFLVGEAADSVFGSGRGIRRVSSAFSGKPARALLDALEHIPGSVGRRAAQVGGYAELFGRPTESPDGYAARTLEFYGDNSIAYQMFGDNAVSEYLAAGIAGVTDRVEIEVPEKDRFFRHIEIAAWRNIFSDLALHGNHAAQALGKRQVQPFSSWRVISEHLKIPARDRYVKGLTGKWVLKNLLTRRVPDYKANKRKLATGLPFDRYYRNGPLTGIWQKYAIPDAIPANLRGPLVETPSAVTWNAINHSIWADRIATNSTLQPHAAAIDRRWPIG